jgi:ABC-2 type transport system ATP-binding protein
LPEDVRVISSEKNLVVLRVDREKTAKITAKLLSALQIEDLSVEEPPIEAVIDQIYQEGTA